MSRATSDGGQFAVSDHYEDRLERRSGADPWLAGTFAAADRWRTQSLVSGQSLFGEGRVWTLETAAELKRRFIDEADYGEGTFLGKLHGQLDGAEQEVHEFAAELLYIHLLPLMNVSEAKKLEIINGVGERAPEPFTVPTELVQPLSRGIVNGGVGFNTNRFYLVSFLIEFAVRWLALDEDERSALAGDPWGFKAFLTGIPAERADSQRNALLFLLFTDDFQDMTSNDHKRRIVAAHSAIAGDDPDVDRQLLAIRAALSGEFGKDFNWYSPEVRLTWDSDGSPGAGAATVLSAAIPDVAARVAFAELMAASIQAAHAVNPHAWSVSLLDDGVTLNVGINRSLAAVQGNYGVVLSAKSEFDAEAIAKRAGVADTEVYAFDFPADNAFIRTTDQAGWSRLLTENEEAHIAVVQRTATRNTPFARYFSEDAVSLIETLSGEELPRPPRGDSGGAWVVRMKFNGRQVVQESVQRGVCRVFWQADVSPGASIDEVRDKLSAAYPDQTPNQVRVAASGLHRFITKMGVGDLVLAPDGGDLLVGTVTSEARFDQVVGEWNRGVDWHNADAPISRSDISPGLYSQLRSLLTIIDVGQFMSELASWIEDDGDIAVVPTTQTSVHLRPVDRDTADGLLLDRTWLQDIVDMLEEKRQLIFYGPPGTGKTYLAEGLAAHLTADFDASNFRIVQFHPSYAYEDFVEGFRPQTDGGTMTYELRPGPFLQLAKAARDNPSEPYILIIDEINRGNLAKIFGELYYLLEYRDHPIVLQYGSEEEFSLPENLYVIGTMNTADRSIAMVDAAIRRRFWFVEFSPTKAPIDGVLRRWLDRQQLSDRAARILDELNSRLHDSDYAIGPSYLMNKNIDDDKILARIWDHAIMPLLTEHFYGQRGATDRFELAQILRSMEPQSDDDGTVESEPAEGAPTDDD